MKNSKLLNNHFGYSRPRRRKLCVLDRLIRYFRTCAYRGATYIRFCIETFARRLRVSVRSIQYARRQLEEAGYTFCKRREGRSDCLYAVFDIEEWDRLQSGAVHPAKASYIGDFSSRNNKKKHAGAGLGFVKQGKGDARLRRKAAWLVRKELRHLHYDNCKVVFRFAHAFNFAVKALKAGFVADDIVAAYDNALHQRHRDATDAGLGQGNPGLRWEPSSTVSLAWSLLSAATRRFGAWGRETAAQSYESWLEGCTERDYGAWRDYAVRRAGEDAFLDQDMAVLEPLWEPFRA